ncbi:MAG: hypothetical protein H0T12_04220, partial [Actinobacteria bacterium]|nr:hypothetical protein [Actinomycetota bacterium]
MRSHPKTSTRPEVHVVDVIRAKRDGTALSERQIRWFIDAYTKGDVADEQASA